MTTGARRSLSVNNRVNQSLRNGSRYQVRCALHWKSLLLVCLCCISMRAQTDVSPPNQPTSVGQPSSDTLMLIDRLVEQNGKLEKQNTELMEQIQSLRLALTKQGGQAPVVESQSPAAADQTRTENVSGDVQEGEVGPNTSPTEEPYKWGKYTPNLGFKVADTEHGDLNISIYTYARYLN